MNRSIVIFVALAVLVAHSLAIRTDTIGAMSPPYDRAYAAFRVAHNLVFEGKWTWSVGVSGFESYPSTLWVLICAAIERLALPINMLVRCVGVTASGASLIFATRFHPDRTASLITPLLLAISGAMAASAVSGTESALLAALITGTFLAYERRHSKLLGLSLVLTGFTRDEGWMLAVVFFVLRLIDRRSAARKGKALPKLSPFLAPLLGFLALTAMRWHFAGQWISAWMTDLVDLRPGEVGNGLAYIRDFFVVSASPCLLIYCFWYLMRRYLSPTGKRALLLIMAWMALIVLQGGGYSPFSESMVPILPLILIASQEGLITARNSTKVTVRSLASASFYVAVFATALGSFRPRDIGPIPLEGVQRRWMASTSAPRLGFNDQLGRLGLDEETLATNNLREIGIFMRDELDPRYTVLSPWTGSLAYLSRMQVRDLLGQTTAAPPSTRTSHAPYGRRVDVLAALRNGNDYILPAWRLWRNQPLTPVGLAEEWSRNIDFLPGRQALIVAALEEYEWLTIPLKRRDGMDSATLLRKRSLGLGPKLIARLSEGELVIDLEHQGHPQLCHLVVYADDAEGERWYLNPTGRMRQGEQRLARSNMLITETAGRRIHLMRAVLPEDLEVQELVLTLRNTGSLGGPASPQDSGSDLAAEIVVLPLH